MRLFVAVEVPDDVRSSVDAAVSPLRERYPRLRWTRPEAWHLTLAFLGEVDEGTAEELPEVFGAVAADVPGPIELALAAPGRFGGRVLWLGVDDRPAGALAELGARLQEAAHHVGIGVDRKPVRPHLTLARGRGRDRGITPQLVRACPQVDASWSADELALLRSHLGGGPARYERLAALRLGT